MAQTKENSSPVLQKEPDLKGALEDLKILAQKPKKIPPETVVEQGFPLIELALKQGYNFTEISKVFAARGVKISTQELRTQFEVLAEKESEEQGEKGKQGALTLS
jgi:hypothetical protein